MGRRPKKQTEKSPAKDSGQVPMKSRTLGSVGARMTIKPLMGYVLIEPSEAQTKTSSGIILPESAQEKPAMGLVLACGDDVILENGKTLRSPVKPGDKVYYKKWGGDEIKIEGRELKLVKFDDLMAILE